MMQTDNQHRPSLWELICEDWKVHGKDWSRPGFHAIATYRFGAWCAALRYRPLRSPLSRLHRLLYRFVRNVYGIELPYQTKVGRRCFIAHQSGIVIHPLSEIGDDCIIRQNVTLGAPAHDRGSDAPIVGNDVHLGAGAVLLGNIKVGDGARISANTVVMTNVPDGSFVFNTPSKVMKNPKTDKLEEEAKSNQPVSVE